MKLFRNNATFLRYVLVGMATGVVYFLCGFALGQAFLLDVGVITTIAFLAAVVFNYALHFYFTFDAPGAHLPVASRYIVMVACGMLINWWLAELLYPMLQSVWLVQLVSMVVVVAWNMVLSVVWVFAGKGRA